MKNSEVRRYSKVSWLVFLFTISIVLISLVPVIFPALFSETFFKTELSNYDISETYEFISDMAHGDIMSLEIFFTTSWLQK